MDAKSYPPPPPPPPRDEAWVMGTPITPQYHPASHQATWIPIDYTPEASAAAGGYNPSYGNRAAAVPNPYIHVSPVPGSTGKRTNETICKVMDRCGKKLEASTKKAGDLVTNVWHHLKTGPSITDAAMARLAQGTKVFAEGGNERVFHQNFGTYTGEKLRKTFACYLSTSTGPVIGSLYLSSLRLAFYSDKALCHYTPSGQQESLHYKVAVPLNRLKAVNPASNLSEKYIQMVTSDNHEFWFMGFVSYDNALKNLKHALHSPQL